MLNCRSSRFARRLLVAFAALPVAGLLPVASLRAQGTVYYWDTNGTTAGTGTTGGNWSTTGAAFWNTNSDGTTTTPIDWVNSPGTPNDAVFAAGTNAIGSYTVTLTTAINAGNLSFEDGTVTVAGASILTLGSTTGASTPTVTVAASRSATISAVIAGDDGLTKAGTGTLTLSGANTYTGATSVNAGTLTLGAANRLADSTALTVASGATFNLAGFSETVGSLAGAGNVTLGSGTLTAGGDDSSTTFSGALSGTGGLTKTGAGTLTLSGANTFTGATTISAGTVTLGATERLSNSSSLVVAFGGLLELAGFSETLGSIAGGGAISLGSATLTAGGNGTSTTFSGEISGTGGLAKAGAGTLTLSGANTFTGPIALSGGTLVMDRADDFTLGNTLSGTGAFSKAGVGILTLASVNNSSGATTVSAGTLRLGAAERIANTAAVTVSSGATFDLADYSETIGSLAGAGAVSLGSATLGIGGANTSTTFSGVISGTGGLIKTGTGTLALTGAGTYTGLTTISAGAINIQHANALGTTASGTTVASGAALQIQGGVTVGAEALTLNGTGISSTGALRNISGTNDYSGLVTLGSATRINSDAGSTLTLSNPGTITGATFGLTVGGSGNTTINSVLGTTSGTLTKDGTGTLTLSGSNAYTGLTTVSAGVLNIQNATALGTTASGTTVASGAALQLQSGITVGAEALTLNGTGISSTGALRNISGINDYAGLVTLSGATRINSDAGTLTLSNSGTITGATFGLTVGGAGDTTINSIIGTTSGTLTKDGAGTLTLGGANTYTGATTINAGTLTLGGAERIADASALTVASGATFNLANYNATVGSLVGAGNVILGSATLTTGGLNSSTTLSGVVSGTGGLTKVGAGTLTLTAVNTYTGATTVNAGTLLVNGSTTAGSAVTVASGATLSGGGTVAGTVTAHGTIAPGAGLAAGNVAGLRTGALTFSGTGSLVENVGRLSNDSLVVAGTANLSGNLTVNASNPDQSLYTLLSATSITGSFTTFSNIPSGYGVQVTPTQVQLGKLLLTASSLTASDGATSDQFGSSVSQSGTIGLVGAFQDDIGAKSNQGSAYVFRGLDTATGTSTQNVKLTASDGAANDRFGTSVSLSGTIGLVGARGDVIGVKSDQGSAYVFRGLDTATGTVTQDIKLTASDGEAYVAFGCSVSLSGTIGLVGAFAVDTASTTNHGAAYVFRSLDTATGAVTQNAKLTASDFAENANFGWSVSQSGTIGLIGAYGDVLNKGAAYVFRGLHTATGAVTQNVKLTASDGVSGDEFGYAVSQSGTIGLIGSYKDDIGANSDQGSAYVFRGLDTATGTVTQNVKLTTSDGAAGDQFGNAVSLSGTTGLIGAFQDDIGTNSNQGSAYVFQGLDAATGTVTQNVKLTASDGAANDQFGTSVSLSGEQFTVGASGKNGSTGKAYTGTVSSLTTLDLGNATRTIDGISFVSQDDWIIGQSSDANQVALTSGDSGTVTASGKAVYIGRNAGSDNNTLVIAGTLTATQINIGAAGNTGNVLQLGDGGTTGTLSTSGTITNHGTFAINRSNAVTQGTDFSASAISGTGGLTQMGTGTTTLTAANTYTGATTVSGGTLALGAANRIADTSALSVASGATFNLAGFAETVGSLAGAGSVTLGAATLTAGGDGTSTSFSGVISGAGAFTKTGSGTLELTGANTYAGGTSISAGVVRINNATGSAFGTGAVTVAEGATLTGAGSFTGSLQVNGTYSPGNSPAAVSLGGNVTLGSTSLLVMEIGGATPGTGYDTLSVGGMFNLGGTLRVSFLPGYTLTSGTDHFTFFTASSFGGSFAQVEVINLPAGLNFDPTPLLVGGSVTVSAIPEPSAYAMLLGLGVLTLASQRRSRRRSA